MNLTVIGIKIERSIIIIIMSLCFCSILKPSFLNRELNFVLRSSPNPNIKPFHFATLHSYGKRFSLNAVRADEVGVLYPDDAVSERTAPVDVEAEGGLVNGVETDTAATEVESDEGSSQIGVKNLEKKRGDVEESERENRFKTRNGREVYHCSSSILVILFRRLCGCLL